jgi:hypothetical protein
MQLEKLELLRCIAEMAYVIAKVDKGLSSEERIAFYNIIEEELEYDAWAAQSRFELLDEVIQPDIDKAYNEAMFDLRKYRKHLTPEIKEKTIRVMQRVADSSNGFNEKEAFIMDRVKRDLQQL